MGVMDDTAYVQGWLDRGEPVPAGEYKCRDGVAIPGDYAWKARAAGRPEGPDGYPIGEGPIAITYRGDGGWETIHFPAGVGVSPPKGIRIGAGGRALTLVEDEMPALIQMSRRELRRARKHARIGGNSLKSRGVLVFHR